jgi:hypothetical protein
MGEGAAAVKLSEFLTIAAIVLGPILAVQVEKLVEARRERNRARRGLFHALMATRAARVSPDHVRALNAIDLVFRKDKEVREAWKVYLDHLNDSLLLEKDPGGWAQRGDDYLVKLLAEMSAVLKYDFDEVQLRRAIYFHAPMAKPSSTP